MPPSASMVAATPSTSSTRSERWVRPSWFIGRRSPSPVVPGCDVAEQLDGDPVPWRACATERDPVHLHEGGELLPDLVGRHLLETQSFAVEAQRALEVGDADPEMRDGDAPGWHVDALARVAVHGFRPARRPGWRPGWSSWSVAPPRVSSRCLVIRKYRCSGYSRSTPTPPWRWTAAWTTRWPPSAAQNLAMATSLSAGSPSAIRHAACQAVSRMASAST